MFLASLGAPLALVAAADEPPLVVVSIKPLYSLVAGVMGDGGHPILLVSGMSSPHDYALRPSDATTLERATRLFWMGPTLEGFLEHPVRALDPNVSVELGKHIKNYLHPIRSDKYSTDEMDPSTGHDEEDSNGHDEEEEGGHRHDQFGADGQPLLDLHAWLDPVIAIALVDVISEELSKAEPADAARFRGNAAALKAKLKALDAEIAASLAPVKDRPFMVFHDGYQYFEARYGLRNVGALSLSPEHPPGARHLDALRQRIERGDVACVFAEPQFEPKMVRTLVAGTSAHGATLDPLGSALPEGPEAYFALIRALASNLRACLSG
jgi:zinc transport system substrate-binding protein